MPRATQLTVRCVNRPGTLAHIATVMGLAKVNINGFLLTTSGARGFVKLIVDDVARAKEALEEADLPYRETVVLHAKLKNVPGALGRFAGKLAGKGINIRSAFQTAERDSKMVSVVMEVSHLGKAVRLAHRTPSDLLYD